MADRRTLPVNKPVLVARDEALAMAASDPELLRQLVVQEGAPAWVDGMKGALTPREPCAKCGQTRYERWAFRLWAQVAKLVGITPQVQALIIQQIGAPVEEARDAVRIMRDISTDEDRLEVEARAFLDRRLRARGIKLVEVPYGNVVRHDEGEIDGMS